MRSFEERKAEVFRRSENRIKERRKARSRALAVCIPLCLIITVWSVMVLPAMLPVNNKKSGATDERAETSGSDTYDAAPVYVIIFTAADGGQTCYMLNDHILIDNAAKKETVLTEEQYVQLLQALGVVLKKEDGK